MLLYLSCITFKLDIFKIFKKSKKSKYSLHQLQMLLKSQVQGKLLHPLKHKLAQNVQVWLYFTFLFSSIMIPGLLSACLNTELHLLPVSEALNFGGWPFSITVTRYFKPKSGHSNERVYRKSIDRILKTLHN